MYCIKNFQWILPILNSQGRKSSPTVDADGKALICDLSRENHTNEYPFERQNARLLNGWQTGGRAVWNGYHERLNGWGKNLNGWSWTAERQKKIFERFAVNSWTAEKKIRTAHGERLNGRRKISNGSWWTAERQKKNFKRLALNGRRNNFERLSIQGITVGDVKGYRTRTKKVSGPTGKW